MVQQEILCTLNFILFSKFLQNKKQKLEPRMLESLAIFTRTNFLLFSKLGVKPPNLVTY